MKISSFGEFIDRYTPVYTGTDTGEYVVVKLENITARTSLCTELGSGDIFPYMIPSMYEPASNNSCFEYNSNSNTITFEQDNYGSATVLKLSVSADFQKLYILDKFTDTIQGTLHIRK